MRLSGLHHQETKRPSVAKKVAIAALGTAAAAGSVLYLAKTGKLNPVEGGNKHIESVKATLKKSADKVLNSEKFASASAKATELLGKGKEKLVAFKESDAYAKIQKGIGTVKDKIKSVLHPEKIAK